MMQILTLNLNYYADHHGPWEIRRGCILEAVQQVDPDILAFQAVRRQSDQSNGADQIAQIAEQLPQYTYSIFQPAVIHADGSADGNGFLSRYSILESDHRPLSLIQGLEDSNHRIVLRGMFTTPVGPLHVFNAHFSWVEEQARENIAETLGYMNMFNGLAVLLGDFNTPSDSHLLEAFRKQGWIDVWKHLHPDDDGFTFDSARPFTRIDYVWAGPHLSDRILSARVITPGNPDMLMSDHFGLLVQLS